MIELKPCPFCGSYDVFSIEVPYDSINYYLVKCSNCNTYGPRWAQTEAEGIKAWNERKTHKCAPKCNLIKTYLDGYKKGMQDTENLLKPFVKEGVLND